MPEGLVVDVGGVGYLVAATSAAVRKADGADEISLHTYLHVREDALQLYGFADASNSVELKLVTTYTDAQGHTGDTATVVAVVQDVDQKPGTVSIDNLAGGKAVLPARKVRRRRRFGR